MDILKIRIKFGDVEIELEGDKEVVQKEYQNLKEHGVGNLIGNHSALPAKSNNGLPEQVYEKPAHVAKQKKKISDHSKEPRPKVKGKTSPFKLLTDLNYKPKGGQSLIDFINGLPFRSNVEKILGIVYFCKETLNIANVTSDHIFTGFKELKIPIPPTLYQVIVNVKNRNGWITFDKMDDINYTIQGGNFIEHDLTKRTVSGKS